MNDIEHNENYDQHHDEVDSVVHESDVQEPREDVHTQKPSSNPVIFASMLALIVVILALVYMWGSSRAGNEVSQPPETYPPELPQSDTESEAYESTYAPDTLDAIERDLISTDIESLDAELDSIESELDTLLAE